ncbi:MAG: hypothetical protein K9J74_07140 [Sulfuritalea sp.]|nr:hypothetical protein [Sulfuritalea sp.]
MNLPKRPPEGKKLPAQKLREAGEKRDAGAPLGEQPRYRADALLHELQVHQIELEMQNEALRQAQIALEDSRARYADLNEHAPALYLTLTDKGLIAEINLAGEVDRQGVGVGLATGTELCLNGWFEAAVVDKRRPNPPRSSPPQKLGDGDTATALDSKLRLTGYPGSPPCQSLIPAAESLRWPSRYGFPARRYRV